MKVSGICGKCGKFYEGQHCPECANAETGETMNFIADFHEEYFDQALGEVVKSRQHRKQLMKEKGLFEIGNEWKYVDPAANRRKHESRIAKEEEVLKGEAYRFMQRASWN